jgi:hypothetical protein
LLRPIPISRDNIHGPVATPVSIPLRRPIRISTSMIPIRRSRGTLPKRLPPKRRLLPVQRRAPRPLCAIPMPIHPLQLLPRNQGGRHEDRERPAAEQHSTEDLCGDIAPSLPHQDRSCRPTEQEPETDEGEGNAVSQIRRGGRVRRR